MMWKRMTAVSLTVGLLGLAGCGQVAGERQYKWSVHDMSRPRPVVVTPGAAVGAAPSDAVVLFGGKDLSQWASVKEGQAPTWQVRDGYMEVAPKTGSIRTKEGFGDCQLHVEWATPAGVRGKSQSGTNSGIFLMGRYEVQVLNSHVNETYADGQAAAIYGQYPPLVNACREAGQWQTYDIVFRRPHFDKEGAMVQPARMTVFQNGVLVQDSTELLGTTTHKKRAKYELHADKEPIMLQDHSDPVRYRNIWVRQIGETPVP